MKNFLARINYSSINEDSISEIRALNIKSSDRVLCITGSGSRTLDLLTQNPKEIISIDINPCQNYLLELKMMAIQEFEYHDFIRFLGLEKDAQRLEKYYRVSHLLSKQAKRFWDKNQIMIHKGVFYQGKWEKYFRLLAVVLKIIKGKQIEMLFNCQSLDGQVEIWKNEWDDWIWRTFLKTASSRMCWKYLFRDPGFYKYVPPEFSINSYLREKFNSGVAAIQFNLSPFITMLMRGEIISPNVLPPHLRKENLEILKNNLDRVKIITASINEYLKKTSKQFDSFSLSDISSYMTHLEYEKLYERILSKAKAGARICERQFLAKKDIPMHISELVNSDINLEKDLEKSDNSLFYSFHCLSKNKRLM